MSSVLAFGTFDYFHPGHAAYLQQAALLGNHLTVIVARDDNVLKIKKHLPRQSEKVRCKEVKKFLRTENIQGRVFLGLKKNRLGVLKKYQPAVIALGYDQLADLKSLRQEAKNLGLHIVIKRLKPYKPEKYKSSYCLN